MALDNAFRIGGLGALVALAATALAQRPPANPIDWLVRGLDSTPLVVTTLIQSLHGDGRHGVTQIKLQTDGRGRSRRTILQPLSKQGVVQTDDGNVWVTFFPDARQVMAQPSPSAWQLPAERRTVLVSRNYKVTYGETGRIAGRVTVQVVARPNDRELPIRIFDLDQRTNVLLRSAVQSHGPESVRVQLDTLAASFPTRVDGGFYERPSEPDWRQLKCDGPARVERPSDLGFNPVVPERLPRGFVVMHVHRMTERDAKVVGVRLTDGLASATVYQWSSVNPPEKLPFRSSRAKVNADGVAFRIVGDLPDEVEEDLLSAFLRNRRDLKTYSGTPWFEFFVDSYINPQRLVLPNDSESLLP